MIESKKLTTGQLVYRWRCATCSAYGVWLSTERDVSANGALHQRSMHAVTTTAVA